MVPEMGNEQLNETYIYRAGNSFRVARRGMSLAAKLYGIIE
jgi:hypothetical protein